MTNPSPRYQSEAQLVAQELQDYFYEESTQQILQLTEITKVSHERHVAKIRELRAHINFLDSNHLDPVFANEISLRGNVNRTSMYHM